MLHSSFKNKYVALSVIVLTSGKSLLPFIMFIGHLIFFNKSVFRHLKLEIALAIPASNDEKHQELI